MTSSISDESKSSEFLTAMLRQQFILFYRFGHTYIPKSSLIGIETGQDDSLQDKLVELFSQLTPFEYDEEYLIIKLNSDKAEINGIMEFKIQNILSIIPLSVQALNSIEAKSDKRIAFAKPLSVETYTKIESMLIRKDVDNGIKALFGLCGIKADSNEAAEVIGLENLLEGLRHRRSGTKAAQLLKNNFWEIAMAYDRYDYYPKSNIGFFLDAVQVFGYSKGHADISASKAFGFLNGLSQRNASLRFEDIVKELENSNEAAKYVQESKKNGIREYVVAPMFFMLREELRGSTEIGNTTLHSNSKIYEKFGKEYPCVLIMLAAFFGFKKFYDDYYDTLNLKFFKKIPTLVKDNIAPRKEKKAGRAKAKKKAEVNVTPELIVNIVNKLLTESESTKIKVVCESLKNELKKSFTIKEIKEVLSSLKVYEFCKSGRVEFLRRSKIPKPEEEEQNPTLGFKS